MELANEVRAFWGFGKEGSIFSDSRDFECGLQQVLLHVTFDQLKPQADLAEIKPAVTTIGTPGRAGT